jgi:hypothetical protein
MTTEAAERPKDSIAAAAAWVGKFADPERYDALDLASIEAPALAPSGVSILGLTLDMCRWIADEPPPGKCLDPLKPIYCGAEKIAGGPYCPAHMRLAYRRAR